MEQTKSQRKSSWTGFFIGLGLVVVIIIVIIALAKGGSKQQSNEDSQLAVVGVAAQDMEPFATGPFVYQFKDIDWVFDVNDEEGVGIPLTDVKLWFTDFSRHNGATVNFEKPYKLGTYQGDCQEVSALEFDASSEEDTPLAFAQCTYDGEVTDIAVFQNKNMIYFKKRLESSDEGFGLLYDLDMTEMVK